MKMRVISLEDLILVIKETFCSCEEINLNCYSTFDFLFAAVLSIQDADVLKSVECPFKYFEYHEPITRVFLLVNYYIITQDFEKSSAIFELLSVRQNQTRVCLCVSNEDRAYL